MGQRRVMPFDVVPVAMAVCGGIGPEGVKGIRRYAGARTSSVLARLALEAVRWSSRSVMDAFGEGGQGTHPRPD